MLDYKAPAPHWNIYGIKTETDYRQRFVLPVRFHTAVPADVQEAYETVEYLTAFAWHYWPLYDEAYRKLLTIFEMAVRQRCQQVGILPEKPIAKEKHTSLNNLINALAKLEPNKGLQDRMHTFRNLRNREAHPSAHTFGGIYRRPLMVRLINMINLVFTAEKEIVRAKAMQKRLEEATANLRNEGLFVLDKGTQRLLCTSVELKTAFPYQSGSLSVWLARPVLSNTAYRIARHEQLESQILTLQAASVAGGHLQGTCVRGGQLIQFHPTDKAEDIKALRAYQQDLRQANESDVDIYKFQLAQAGIQEVQEVIYRFRWQA